MNMYSGAFDFFWIIKPNLNQAVPMAYTRSLAEWITKPKRCASQFARRERISLFITQDLQVNK